MAKPLEGGIAKEIAKGLKEAKLTKLAVLTKITTAARMPGAESGGHAQTPTPYLARGIVTDYSAFELANTLIAAGDRKIKLIGRTIAGRQVPVPGDTITIEAKAYTIVAVARDAASAVYTCQARGT